jgi:predicted DNA binding CopG/RHH family protein
MVSKKIRRTLRLTEELDRKITEKASEMGISFNAYVSMVLAKELQGK